MQALPAFDYLRPADLAAALRARAERPASRFIAGGTDLIANIRRRIAEPEALIDLGGIAELRGIESGAHGLRIGAGVTLAALADHAAIRTQWPALAAAAGSVAGATHRETATVGGNLCLDTRCVFYNQSDWWRRSNAFCLKLKGETCHVAPTGTRCHAAFSGDLAPALLVHGAEVELAGPTQRRRIPLEQLYADDGARHLTLAPDELVVAVQLPPKPWAGAYEKARLRAAIDFPLAGVAVALQRDGDALAGLRVALTGTNSNPIVLAGTDKLIGKPLDDAALEALDKLVQKQVSPMRTTLAPAHYRRRVAAALARRLAARLYGDA